MTPTTKRPRVKIVSRLPTNWADFRGLVAQGDIRVNQGRLRAKLVVFDTQKSLRLFWNKRLGLHSQPLGTKCLGVVNSLRLCKERFGKGDAPAVRQIDLDRRYFCIIGLLKDHLTMRIISHESVHAAYAFEQRRVRSWWDAEARQHDEEAIAYPVGEIAANIVRFLNRKKLL